MRASTVLAITLSDTMPAWDGLTMTSLSRPILRPTIARLTLLALVCRILLVNSDVKDEHTFLGKEERRGLPLLLLASYPSKVSANLRTASPTWASSLWPSMRVGSPGRATPGVTNAPIPIVGLSKVYPSVSWAVWTLSAREGIEGMVPDLSDLLELRLDLSEIGTDLGWPKKDCNGSQVRKGWVGNRKQMRGGWPL